MASIGNSTLAIIDILSDINRKIRENRPIAEISPLIDEISMENEKIKVLAGFVSLANFNMKVEWLENQDIIQYITEYLQRIKSGTLRFKFTNENVIHRTRFRPLEISIMLDNFISNSKKAQATAMSTSFEIKNKELHISISDNGKGVDDKHQKYIFDRGYTTTNGSGIGLHHVKSILESMGGNIRFVGNNYQNYGKGACFEIVVR